MRLSEEVGEMRMGSNLRCLLGKRIVIKERIAIMRKCKIEVHIGVKGKGKGKVF